MSLAATISQEELVSALRYEGGNLFWRKTGKKAGCFSRKDGYGCVRVNRRLILLHRAVWIYHFGTVPEGMDIDHVDLDRLNNRIENLRLATRSQNHCNRGVRKDSLSGIKNVLWNEPTRSWRVMLSFGGKRRHIGLFDSLDEAVAAATHARIKHHGAFANHGADIGGGHFS